MEGINLKEDVLAIKSRLEKVEMELKSQIESLAILEGEWNQMDKSAEEMIKSNNQIVKFNIIGKKFQTRLETLLKTKDTLFYKMILSKAVDLNSEIFFDRNPKYFGIILDFLRNKKFELKRYKSRELSDLRSEAEYFEITEINNLFGDKACVIEFISYEFNGPYITSGITVGTNKIEDLTDSSGMKGICCTYNGWIVVELNDEFDINGISILGYRGNPTYWSNENGSGATIYVSTDKNDWKQVGTIPSGYGTEIKHINFSSIQARYLKFTYSSYLGIGYLNVKRT